ncbi:unnamed protein product [Auanema sp. JU1783]|nr:unnamed protein product [Auanema sp. JU1783]
MKGLGTSIAPIQAGIKYDLDQLLMKFKEDDSVRFREFSKVFRELEMELIFYGRQNCAELVEFTERLLQMALAYLAPNKTPATTSYNQSLEPTDPEYDYTNRIFGVYACYAFYYTQPRDYIAQIRITPTQMHSVTQFIQLYLLPERHYDTLACLYKLIDDAAFKIVIFETCFDPVTHKRYEAPVSDELANDDPEPQFNLAKSLVDDPLLAQIELIHKKYAQGKDNLKVGLKLPKDPLDICKSLLDDAQTRFKNEMVQTHAMMTSSTPVEVEVKTVARSSIKEKAYSSKIQHSRSRRYADPEMAENYSNLVNNQGVELEEVELEIPAETKPKTPKRRSKSTLSTSTVMEDKDKTLDMLEQNINNPRKRNRRKTGDMSLLEEGQESKTEDDTLSILGSPSSKKRGRRLPSRPQLPPDFEVTKMLETKSAADDIDLDDLRAD